MAGELPPSDLLPDLGTFKDNLGRLPSISQRDLFAFVLENNTRVETREVPLKAVMAQDNSPTWDLGDQGVSGVYDFAQKIVAGKVVLSRQELPILFECEGLYGILSDGTHRIAALKGINNESGVVTAEVKPLHPFTKVEGFTKADMEEVERRRQAGLWAGTLEGKHLPESFPTFYFSGHVDRYDGPWVFARNMAHAKALYDLVAGR